ncbi:TPA: DUF2681 domain-containing protein [Pasteurella multocida]|uniref:DUF2681 domain-containing protein n=2 Tax=Pasteurella multocida TaxID=747 RepID=UPI00027B11FF|nr:DUF2681 domain-containing protein [Pasteurella multocida]EJS85459.1 hypothetical protein AAUPMB_20632 [Pasteurella multocida subsp. multocida str. Anand1_buffalo]APB78598.1 hypothetical protein BMF22_00485 [Pasteurella multocida]ATC22304.1 DUF2681 domain-containing protein [Pasteurella multocida]EJS83479.1 hypothetical protein KCU_10481 [Pasteurella multocida subsp. multocida str. P52VAC]EPE74978.1 hypothetical protein I010_08587 [Pasteurella multocida 1500C]
MIVEKIIPLALLAGSLASFVGYKSWQVAKARKENEKLNEQNHQLQTEKAVVETQVKNYEVRKQHEENISSSSRDSILDQLQQNGDLRGNE